VPLRVKTNGLVASASAAAVAAALRDAGVDKVSVGLASDNPKGYAEILQVGTAGCWVR